MGSLSIPSVGAVLLLVNKYSQSQKEMQDILGREGGSDSGLLNGELFILLHSRKVPDTKTSSELCPPNVAFPGSDSTGVSLIIVIPIISVWTARCIHVLYMPGKERDYLGRNSCYPKPCVQDRRSGIFCDPLEHIQAGDVYFLTPLSHRPHHHVRLKEKSP